MPDLEQAAYDYGYGLIGFGIPSAYHLASATAERDIEEFKYALAIEAGVLATQYGILRFLNWYQGPKYHMTFHALHRGFGVVRSLAFRAVVTNPLSILAAGAAISLAQGKGWGLGDYRNTMAEHRSHYSSMTQRKMR